MGAELPPPPGCGAAPAGGAPPPAGAALAGAEETAPVAGSAAEEVALAPWSTCAPAPAPVEDPPQDTAAAPRTARSSP